MKFKITAAYILLSILFSTNSYSQTTTGPENGSLVVVGGGKVGTEIIQKFIELAGGKEANFIVIPTAAGSTSYSQNAGISSLLRNQGVKNVRVLHANSKKEANEESFILQLKNADAIWFGGGRQWRLVDAYADTKAEKAFWELLQRGGVIGGSSAGATIQGSYLARGDTKNNQIMMGDHEKGFGFMKNIAIDQHVLARNRQFDLFDILRKKPGLLGIGLDESTAIVVEKNQFEVIGESYVLVYDQSFWSREGSNLKTLPTKNASFYFLKNGDKYDLSKRKVIK